MGQILVSMVHAREALEVKALSERVVVAVALGAEAVGWASCSKEVCWAWVAALAV
jgi:hypothetical protein